MLRFAIILSAGFSLIACSTQYNARSSRSYTPFSPLISSSPLASSSPQPSPRERQFLRSDRIQFDQDDRQNFLNEAQIERIDRVFRFENRPAYLINHRLINHQNLNQPGFIPNPYPASPIIHNYHYEGQPIDFSVRLPASFAINLPPPLRQALLSHPDVMNLELYFTPQINSDHDYVPADHNDSALKAHYWLVPDAPERFGFLYNRNHPMMMTQSDYPMDRHLRNDQWVDVNVNIHHNTYSPPGYPHGGGVAFQLNPYTNQVVPVSFWSVVVDPAHQRAAVTLHWMLPDDGFIYDDRGNALIDPFSIVAQFREALARHAGQAHLRELVEDWNQIQGLQNTPMMQKLRQLIQI